MADDWEKNFVDRMKGTHQSVGREQIGKEYAKHVSYVFDIFSDVCEKLNSLSEEKIAHINRENNTVIVWVKQYYLRAVLDERGTILFSSNGSVLSFTKASPLDSHGKIKWVYKDYASNRTHDITQESIKLLFEEAFRNA